jgi:hypothetical protein
MKNSPDAMTKPSPTNSSVDMLTALRWPGLNIRGGGRS